MGGMREVREVGDVKVLTLEQGVFIMSARQTRDTNYWSLPGMISDGICLFLELPG